MSDFKAKCTKFNFGWGSASDPAGGAYNAALDQDQCNKLLLQTYAPIIVLLVLRVKKLVRENDSFYLEKSGKMNYAKQQEPCFETLKKDVFYNSKKGAVNKWTNEDVCRLLKDIMNEKML